MYIIYNKFEKLYWNNELGWVDKKSATRFMEKEVKKYQYIPFGSEYIKLKGDN